MRAGQKSLAVLILVLCLKRYLYRRFRRSAGRPAGKDVDGLSASTAARLKEHGRRIQAQEQARSPGQALRVYFWIDGIHERDRPARERGAMLVGGAARGQEGSGCAKHAILARSPPRSQGNLARDSPRARVANGPLRLLAGARGSVAKHPWPADDVIYIAATAPKIFSGAG